MSKGRFTRANGRAMAKVVIIGAGLTGLSAAYHLEQAGFYDYEILEQEHEVGGLCRSLQQDGFTFDYTGHLLHLSNDYARGLVQRIFPEEHFAKIQRKSAIYSHNTYTRYPFQINLHGLPHDVIVDCIESFVQRSVSTTPPTSFRSWVLSQFGEAIGRHFFFPYQQKIFDINIDELSASWTGRFVPATSLRALLQGALGIYHDEVGYNAQFLYPQQGGIIRWVQGLHTALKNTVRLEHGVARIDGATASIRCTNGYQTQAQHIISTMPLTTLINLLQEKSTTTLYQALPHLRCAGVINFNVGVQRPQLLDQHWVYYPEEQFPFYRVGFPTNLTPAMAPQGSSSLSGECSYLQRTPQEIAARTQKAEDAVMNLFQLAPAEISTKKVIDIPHAYVIFDAWRDEHLPALLNTLDTDYSINSTGRYGAWKYASMQEALLDGKDAAEKALKLCA